MDQDSKHYFKHAQRPLTFSLKHSPACLIIKCLSNAGGLGVAVLEICPKPLRAPETNHAALWILTAV